MAIRRPFVEEVRLASDAGGKLDWVIGGFFLDRRNDVDYFYRSSPAFLASARAYRPSPDEYYQRQYNHANSHEKAGFGELTYRLTERFWLTGGLRYGGVDAQAFTERAATTALIWPMHWAVSPDRYR